MQLIGLRGILPKTLRRALRNDWNQLLAWEHNYRERRFYRQFVNSGDFVIDIGANVGLKTRALLALGARVLAVEPNPICLEQLKQQNAVALAEQKLFVEQVAVGSKGGQLTLHLNPSDYTTATGSLLFLSSTEGAGSIYTSTLEVSVVTADELIAAHGSPSFIKIDAEGMDFEVLKGLHFRPRYLSFEFNRNPRLWSTLPRCIEEVARLGFAKANFTGSGTPSLWLKDWVPIGEIEKAIAEAENPEGFGDVLVT